MYYPQQQVIQLSNCLPQDVNDIVDASIKVSLFIKIFNFPLTSRAQKPSFCVYFVLPQVRCVALVSCVFYNYNYWAKCCPDSL